ncbi:hypothetical protein DQ384_26065 [Sphaerisporangium album]|uniref:Pycsar effector protein domain-containing protein n=1 Tax=Sphaerisporangium album TaxID=509200 RepID=A0A367F9Z8_9ACTN|nr:Pycsar system effector family protein [Sphaerisporangium album]RCG27188.1 hypothetical protein DQ384_26065 [Sphaerisporangium album]
MDLLAELAGVRAELARTDAKAGTLLGTTLTLAGVAVAAAALTGRQLPLAARVVVWLCVACMIACVALLAVAIRPSLSRVGPHPGWMGYADADPAELAARTGSDHRQDSAAELVLLSRLVRRKYRTIQHSVHLLLASLGFAAALPGLLLIGGA